VEGPVVLARYLAARRVRALGQYRNMRVLTDEERVESSLLDRPRESRRADALVSDMGRDPKLHSSLLTQYRVNGRTAGNFTAARVFRLIRSAARSAMAMTPAWILTDGSTGI